MLRAVMLVFALALAIAWPSHVAHARGKKPRTHRVAKGQRLGSIANRYRVSIAAICHANDISRRSKLKPGMKLIIPDRSDTDGSKARALRPKAKTKKKPAADDKSGKTNEVKRPRKHRWHTIAKGQRLGSIAKRYRVSLAALTHANDISRRTKVRPGRKLIIPFRKDKDGSIARAERFVQRGEKDLGSVKPPSKTKKTGSWSKFVRKPKKPGWVIMQGRKTKWGGQVVTKRGRLRRSARAAFKHVLATAGGKEIDIHPRLIHLVARLSDTFGGRAIRIVSGYRLGRSTPARSRHRTGRAIDLRVAGVPAEALRDFVKTFDKVGVGYYPKSKFVHLDVRATWTYWIDNAGPGQQPQYVGFWTKQGGREVRSR